MSCYHPIPALDLGIPNVETGKREIKILGLKAEDNLEKLKELYGDSLLLLPCGKCIGCINDYKQSWAVRILLEASLYEHNSFITLTYDDAHLPKDNKPHREEIVKFMKRLRKEIGVPIRFFYCGETGTATQRSHYHAIIFGYDFPDRELLKVTAKGSRIFRSKTLEKCWKFGISSVGDVEPGSACYVAQYSMKKKLEGQKEDPSFVGMSRMPGLGCSKFNPRWFKTDTIYCALGEASIPRFFGKMLEGLDPEYYQKWKDARVQRCKQKVGDQYIYGFRNEEEVLYYKENIKLINYARRLQRL